METVSTKSAISGSDALLVRRKFAFVKGRLSSAWRGGEGGLAGAFGGERCPA